MNYKKYLYRFLTASVILIITILIFSSLIIIKNTTISKRFEDLFVSTKEYNKIKESRTKSTLLSDVEIYFDGNRLFQDTDNTLYYSMIENSETATNPLVRFKTSNNTLHLAIKEEGLNTENIAANIEYKIIIYTDNNYQIFTMHVTTLPIMTLDYDESEELDKEHDTQAQFTLFDNRADIKERNITSYGVFHPRGTISYTYPKQGYKISFRTAENSEIHNNISLLGLREDDDYILNGAYYDPEKIRTVFEANLWNEASAEQNEFSIHNGIEYKYVELFENGEYWGIYALGYPVDERVTNLKETNDGLYTEPLFKKISWDKNRQIVNDQYSDWELKNSTTNYIDSWNKLITYDRILKEPESIKEIYNTTDTTNAIELSLFINFTQNCDISFDEENLYNIYLSFHNKNGRTVALFTPWDFDLSLGHYALNTNLAETTYVDSPEKNYDKVLTSVYALQKLGDTNINTRLISRYRELRKNYWSEEHLDSLIADYETQIYDSGAFRRDLVRWPEGRHNDENEKLSHFKDYLHERLEHMDQYINDLENGKINYATE